MLILILWEIDIFAHFIYNKLVETFFWLVKKENNQCNLAFPLFNFPIVKWNKTAGYKVNHMVTNFDWKPRIFLKNWTKTKVQENVTLVRGMNYNPMKHYEWQSNKKQ